MCKKLVICIFTILTIQNISAMSPMSELPIELKTLIVQKVAYSKDAEEAAQALRSLALVNKQFQSIFKKENDIGKIMNLMPTNKMSKFEIALRLGMPAATSWLKNNLHSLKKEFKQDFDKKKLSYPQAMMIILSFINDQMINDPVWQELIQKIMSLRLVYKMNDFQKYPLLNLPFNDPKTHKTLSKTVYAEYDELENDVSNDILFYVKDKTDNEIYLGHLKENRRTLKSLILSYPQTEVLAPLAGGWILTKEGTKTVWIVAPLAGENPEGPREDMQVRLFILILNKDDKAEKTLTFNFQVKEPRR